MKNNLQVFKAIIVCSFSIAMLASTAACIPARPNSAAITSTPTQAQTATITRTLTASPTPSPIPTITPHPDKAPTLTALDVHFVTNANRDRPYVALTFDLCQIPEYPAGFDTKIVELLQQASAPATFFLGGDWMRTHPDETLLLAGDPRFELGNHSWSHPDFRELGWQEMDAEIVKTQDMLYKLTGRQSHLFRLPYGYSNDLALSVIAQHGLYTIQWDVETGDPDPNFDAQTINRAVQESVQNGSIIIMHANVRGWHTAEALPGVIAYLRDQGYTLVTVSQLIRLEPATIS